jgi:type II secretory pathway pseudopilin PulG
MHMNRNRAGTTLVELMIALVVMSIVGAGMVRLMSSQSHFLTETEGAANARNVARSGINLMFTELRRVEPDSGIIAAVSNGIAVRLPYWVGISCGPDAGLSGTHIAMPPMDSLVRADAGYSGYGYIDANSVPHFVSGGSLTNGNSAVCATAGINTVVHPRAAVMKITPASISAPAGTPVFAWQTVVYWFGNSVSHPGRIGLFRTDLTPSTTEEIAAPFDNTAAFAYYVVGSATPVANPVAGSTILGIDLDLIGLNDRVVSTGQTQQARFETSLYFKNR